MIYQNDFRGEKLGALGFGTMRLPLVEGGKNTDIDQERLNEMVDYAIEHGVNYFDNAYPYHGMASETAVGKALARHDRSSFYIADKYPGFQIMSEYDVEGLFEEQLKKCQVDYFDYYLCHNVNDSSIITYLNPEYRILDRILELKKQGKFRHFGFSAHGSLDCIKRFLEAAGDEVEFCQIQLNYLDWTLQGAKEKYEYLTSRGIDVWVMEPCRGGKLAQLDDAKASELKALRPDESIPAWAFRFLQSLPNVKVILSGMSDMSQVEDNCRTFEERKPLSESEKDVLSDIAGQLHNSVPCTGCRYCCEGCPMEIDIPRMISYYNDYNVYPTINISIMLSGVDKDKMPDACIGCGQCKSVCPQGIDIPELMKTMDECFGKLPDWEQVSKEREAAAKALKK